MSRPQLKELADQQAVLLPLSVIQYHRMMAEGIIIEGDPYELLDGLVIRKDRSATGDDPMTVGQAHVWVVQQLVDLAPKIRRLGCHIRIQQPLTILPYSEPEPDGAIVKGTSTDYLLRSPGPEDVLCIIEVADASLRRDRTIKLRIYASAGVRMYVIVNLREKCIEVYSEPLRKGRYSRSDTLGLGERLEIAGVRGRPLVVPVRALLP